MTRTILAGLTLALAIGLPTASGATSEREPYRAIGTEPFWSVEVRSGTMVFTDVSAPDAPVERRIERRHRAQGQVTYVAAPGMQLWISSERCSDGMSDRIFPDRVIAMIDGRRLQGCGGKPLSGSAAP